MNTPNQTAPCEAVAEEGREVHVGPKPEGVPISLPPVRLYQDMTMQDIRLHVGEGPLNATDVLRAANIILGNRLAALSSPCDRGEGVAMYVPMPLTTDGQGPADPHETARVEHQVWDAATNETICTARDEQTARHIAALYVRPVLPEGWVAVPVEATADMVTAAWPWFAHWNHMRANDRRNALINAYRAMLSALPPPFGGGDFSPSDQRDRIPTGAKSNTEANHGAAE